MLFHKANTSNSDENKLANLIEDFLEHPVGTTFGWGVGATFGFLIGGGPTNIIKSVPTAISFGTAGAGIGAKIAQKLRR